MRPTEKDQEGMDSDRNELPFHPVVRRLDRLRPHPSYVKHQISVSISNLAALDTASEVVSQMPIIVTRTGIVIDGHARLELARRRGRQSILCLEYDLTEDEALRWLLLTHRPSRGLNGYCRSVLAVDLEPSFRQKARENQQIGGQEKGSLDLTEDQKVRVRSQVAGIANVSTGSLSNAKRVMTHADPAVQRAAKVGEVRVYRASQWSRLCRHQQLEKLEEFRSCKGVGIVSRKLIQKHVAKMIPSRLVPLTLSDVLKPFLSRHDDVLNMVAVEEIDGLGRIAYFTKDAIGALKCREAP